LIATPINPHSAISIPNPQSAKSAFSNQKSAIPPCLYNSLVSGPQSSVRLSSTIVKAEAAAAGFDLCGIASVQRHPELSFLHDWLAQGYAGEMHYMHRTADRRSDVRAIMPAAQSVISLGVIYNTDRPYSNQHHDAARADIARYAWGDDYHVVIEARLARLLARLREISDDEFEARAYVDTGPVQERVYAQYAGLGWIGKNTCLINEDLGSWIFLAEIICSLALQPDAPAFDQCGSCARCLEACPTGALVDAGVLDATRCLSYLTIELKGAIPEEHRAAIGHHAYGCDICQEVCPWNIAPGIGMSADEQWQPRPGLDGARLLELWNRSDDQLRALLKGSAMKRAGVKRLRRNIAIALGNSRDRGAAAALAGSDEQTVSDPLVAEHVAWALEKLSLSSPSEQEREP
jgi:epoxyqueuosine reductase